jgi:hypothetical protein
LPEQHNTIRTSSYTIREESVEIYILNGRSTGSGSLIAATAMLDG